MSAEYYAEYLFLNEIYHGGFDEKYSNKWIRAEELARVFRNALHEAFLNRGFEVLDRYSSVADLHLSTMIERNIIEQEGDEFMGTYNKFVVASKDGYIRECLSRNEIGARVVKLGDEALERALKILAAREGWDSYVQEDPMNDDILDLTTEDDVDKEEVAVPASDRIVRLNDNEPDVIQLRSELEGFEAALRESNEVGEIFGEERQVLLDEAATLRSIFSRASVRASAALAYSRRSLSYIAEKGAAAVIGEVAKRLLAFIASILA